jgi:hypothetical protein
VSIDATDREMGYRKDDIERLNASLAELPELRNFEVTKQEAVRLLESTIRGLQAKGYRLDKIAELVSARGMKITATTLKNYLHRAKPRRRAGGKSPRGSIGTPEVTRKVDAARPCDEAGEEKSAGGGRKQSEDGAVGRRSEEPGALRSTTGDGSGRLPGQSVGAGPSTNTANEARASVERSGTPAITTRKPRGEEGNATAHAPAVDGMEGAASPVKAMPAVATRKRSVDEAKASFTPREDSDEI